jgi:cell division septal protein FtsQ
LWLLFKKSIIINKEKFVFIKGEKMKKSLLIGIVLVGLSGMGASVLYSQETITTDLKKKIKEIELRGNVSVPTDFVLPSIHLKVGEYFSEEALQEDTNRILKLGEFESVEVKKVDLPGGMNLVFFVKEIDKPVQAIKIKGNMKTRRDEVRACLQMNEGDKYNYQLVQEEIARIYGLQQFEKVEVEKKEIPGGLELIYVVTEFPVLSDLPASEKYGPVKFRSLPSKSGVPYVRSSSIPGFTDNEDKTPFRNSASDYYKEEFYTGSKQGPLMLSIGASHNFLGSK